VLVGVVLRIVGQHQMIAIVAAIAGIFMFPLNQTHLQSVEVGFVGNYPVIGQRVRLGQVNQLRH
jgi:hypothetical protein